MNDISTIDIISRTPGNTSLVPTDLAHESVKAQTWKIDEIYWLATCNQVHLKKMETLITVNMKLRQVKVGVIHGVRKTDFPKPVSLPDQGEPNALPFLTKRTWCSPVVEH